MINRTIALLSLLVLGDVHAQVSGLPDLPARKNESAQAVEQAVAGFAQQAAKQAESERNLRSNPSGPVNPNFLSRASDPSLALPAANGGLSLSRNSLSISTPESRLRIGAGATDGSAVSRVEYSRLINGRFSLGGSLQLGKYQRELIGRGIYLSEDRKYELDTTLSLMKGNPSFDFDSGGARVPVTQIGGVASLRRLFSPSDGIGLHSLGASVWGARASSPNDLSSRTIVEDRSDYFRFLYDPRRISTGRLRGSSLDVQYAPISSLVLTSSLGVEGVKYPMGDGSAEKHTRPYVSGGMKFEIMDNTMFDLRLATGEARTLNASLSGDKMRLAVGVSRGREGALDSKTVMVYVDLMRLMSPRRVAATDQPSLAMRESLQQYADARLLDRAGERPSQLPQTFLAKVDRTGVKEVFVEKAALPAGAQISADARNLLVPVGTGALKVVFVRKNGVDQAVGSQFMASPGELNVSLFELPVPASIDSYIIRLADSTSATYDVKISVGRK